MSEQHFINDEWLINPLTNRLIKKHGRTHNLLLKTNVFKQNKNKKQQSKLKPKYEIIDLAEKENDKCLFYIAK